MVIRSLKDRILHRFPVSIAEVGNQDVWQRCTLGVACVSAATREAESVIQKIIHFIERAPDLEVIQCDVEIH